MKRIGLVLAGTAVLAFVLAAPHAEARRYGCGRGMGGCGWCAWGPGDIAEYGIPNLTQEQSKTLGDLQKKHIEETAQLRSSIAVKGIEIDQLLDQPQPNTDEILAKQKEMNSLQSQLQEACLRRQMEMRSLLTDEQQNEFINRYNQFGPGRMGGQQGQGFGGGRGYGGRGGCGPCW